MEIRISQLFDTYGDFYQPYIPPVMDALKKLPNFKVEIHAFQKTTNSEVQIIPSYYKRRFHERLNSLTNKSSVKLNYLEQQYLKDNVAIVHLQHSYLHTKLKGLLSLPKLERPKIIITLRGADTYVKPWVDKNWRNFYSNYGQNVDAFIVMSAHQKGYLHKHWNIALDNIYVIPISFGHSNACVAKSLSNEKVKVASAFRMCWEKNIEGNLRVIKLLKDQHIPVQYDLYGDGPDVGQVYYLIDKYDLNDCVNYHGRVANNDLKSHLLASDFFLQLSHSESLGMSVIEAQTLGLPAIVSNSDGLPEVVIHEKTGFCVAPYEIDEAVNYMLGLWQSPKQYAEFSGAAIAYSQEHFSIEREVADLSTLYQSII